MARLNQSGKTFLKILIVLILLLVIPVGVWLGVNLWPRSMPEPLFNEVDLPIEETPQGNGWDLFLKFYEDGSLDKDQIMLPPELEEIFSYNIPKDFSDSLKFWGEVQKNRDILEQFIQQRSVPIEKLKQILALPHFVDNQSLDPREEGPPILVLMDLHRLGLAYIIHQMVQGNTTDAYALWLSIFNQDRAWFRSARSLLSNLAALDQLEADLSLLFMLQSFQPPPDFKEILKILKSFQGEEKNFRRAIIYGYLTHRVGVEAMLEEWRKSQDLWIRIVFNRVLFRRDINKKFKTVIKYLKNPEAITERVIEKFDEDEKKDRETWYWWFYNPGGKLLRALIHTNYLEHMKEFYETKKKLSHMLSQQIERLERGQQDQEEGVPAKAPGTETQASSISEFPPNFELANQLEKEPDQVLTEEIPLPFVQKFLAEGSFDEDIQVIPFPSEGKSHGVKVIKIESGSIFERIGWQVGDVILAVQDEDVGTLFKGGDFFADFPQEVGGEWEVLLFRDGKFIAVEIIVKKE